VIIPTKDRAEYINTMAQNLIQQPGDFDLFIADMSSSPDYLKNNWLLNKALMRLQHAGHNWVVVRVEGKNQLCGYQAGLTFAKERKYKFGVASDDDIIFDMGWFEQGEYVMQQFPEAGCLAGMTLLPWMSEEEQKCPDWYLESPEYKGKLTKECVYYHCILIPPDDRIREFEQLYGPFFFSVDEFIKVGGFPQFLSPLGYRGEMWPCEASFFDGKKLLMNPVMRCWHYSAAHGGLKLVQGREREKALKEDGELWERFIEKRQPKVVDPRLP
jgi:hypothetical protein